MTSFDITFIGVGSAFSKIHNNNNILIEVNNKKYLIDCGIKTPQALHDMGIQLNDIDGIIISHIHADHTGGLEEVGFMGKFILNKKFKLIIADDLVKPLWDNTLSGGMRDSDDGQVTLEDYFEIVPYDDLMKFNVESLDILPIKTIHVNELKPNYSFLLDDRVFYSSDMLFDEALLTEIKEVEVIFHDVQFFKGGVHCSLEELETLPSEIRQKIKLMHYGDNFKDFEQKVQELNMRFVNQGEKFTF